MVERRSNFSPEREEAERINRGFCFLYQKSLQAQKMLNDKEARTRLTGDEIGNVKSWIFMAENVEPDLIRYNDSLIKTVVERFVPQFDAFPDIDEDDLYQEGALALLDQARKHDLDSSKSFYDSSYQRIWNVFKQLLKKRKKSADPLVPIIPEEDIADPIAEEMRIKSIMRAIDEVPLGDPRAKDILYSRYALYPDSTDFTTLDELGKRYGLTRERIRQIETGTLYTWRTNSRVKRAVQD